MAKTYQQCPFERFADDAIVIAERKRKPRKFVPQSRRACGSAGWNFIRRTRRLSIARMMTGGVPNEKFDFLGFSVLQKCTGKEVAWPN